MAFTFLKVLKGMEIGKSLYDEKVNNMRGLFCYFVLKCLNIRAPKL